jgi:hypothetical protein
MVNIEKKIIRMVASSKKFLEKYYLKKCTIVSLVSILLLSPLSSLFMDNVNRNSNIHSMQRGKHNFLMANTNLTKYLFENSLLSHSYSVK